MEEPKLWKVCEVVSTVYIVAAESAGEANKKVRQKREQQLLLVQDATYTAVRVGLWDGESPKPGGQEEVP